MPTPLPEVPRNALDDARDLLHQAQIAITRARRFYSGHNKSDPSLEAACVMIGRAESYLHEVTWPNTSLDHDL